MTEQEAIKRTNEAIEAIKKDVQKDVIKDYALPPLVNMQTGRTTGHAVEMQVSTKYDYGEVVMTEWKEKLGADSWNIRVRRNQLWLRFFIHYDEKKEDNV